ncbi:ribosome maturation factor RimM [Thermosynechococcus sichuanensis E542]|uniref:Ribosome maturation factor RimM n=1 Tax=Thermosynechococcus sichuanensis E542 TaxID=2016101 RepID=A0A7D6J3B9_9CYAN|nr:ribosome maturation factor RimM [Thermosynechococcus vestitus]QLL29634.1 ribosome maturation factor RimM [Thermosynechococcus vestitus E542]
MVTPFPETSEWLCIGQIVAAHGLRGEVKVKPFSDFPERFTVAGCRWLRSPRQPQPYAVTLLRGRFLPRAEQFVVTFAEVSDRTAAEALKGAEILVPASDRPPLAANEYHLMDLIGLAVYHQGERVGEVVGLVNAGNDLLEVQLLNPAQEAPPSVYIPFVPAIVPVVDLAARRIEIDPPLGLLP